MAEPRQRRWVRRPLKTVAQGLSLIVASPAGFICWIERTLSRDAEGAFNFFAHCFALLPGLPGVYLRRAFFQMTLDYCSAECYIGFGSLFTHRHAQVEDRVYVGQYALIGCAILRAGSLIGSQSSLLSGPALHDWDPQLGWLPTNSDNRQRIEIGPATWIGERAVVMANVGPGAMVAAGTVVSSAVPPGIVVAGNPARFVRRVGPAEPSEVPAVAAPAVQ
jgi:acetyltransferase-like isoleucine patch superfamily enzyme